MRVGSTGSLLVSQKGKRKAGIAARCPERCLLVGNTEIREIVRYSRNARLTWSVSGFIRYDITVRSPVFTKASLKFNGAIYTAGYFTGWSPISAEKTATGYQVAWKVTGTDQYGTWVTDNNGNYVSSTTMLGSSSALKTAEPLYQQDLNGDGVIGGAGAPPAAIVSGTAGNDTLTSTAANEVLFGNGGSNTFVFAGNFGKDTIADFHPDSDVLQFSHTAFTDVADVLAHSAQVGSDVTVTVDATHAVTLSNTVLSQFDAHNVHLV